MEATRLGIRYPENEAPLTSRPSDIELVPKALPLLVVTGTTATDLSRETRCTPNPFVDVHLQPVLQPLRYVAFPKQRVNLSL